MTGPQLTQVAGLPIGDPELATAVSGGLDRVEELLRNEVHSDYRFVTDTSLHLIEAGGKRFRPLLTLLAAQLASGTSQDVVVAATSVELVHLATLYHDDVMDEATMRRGAQSANSRWDNTVAILTGDYLFAHASRLVSQLGPDAVRIIAETFAELVTGQMRETRGPRADEDAVEHYLAVVAEKTGSLIATSGRFGAMFAGASPEHVAAMRRFGEIIGTAFQVSDDIIDITSVSDDSGKTPGTDLREGVATLPVLYTLAGSGPEVPRLRELGVGTRELGDDEVTEALELLRGSAGLHEARVALDTSADGARAELAALPPGRTDHPGSREGAAVPPVLEVLQARRDRDDRPGDRGDPYRVVLAVEGGGSRATLSAGMVAELAERGFQHVFDAVYGASAGTVNGAWFVAGEAALGADVWSRPGVMRRVTGVARFFVGRPVVDMLWVTEHLYERIAPLDWTAVRTAATALHPMATDAATGASVDLRPLVHDTATLKAAIRASTHLPILGGPPVELGGRRYLDAALAETLPFRTPLADGATHVLLLRTRRADDPAKPPWRSGDLLARTLLRRGAPGAAEAWRTRHSRQLAADADLATEPRVMTIRPPAGSPRIGQLETDPALLREAVAIGRAAVDASL